MFVLGNFWYFCKLNFFLIEGKFSRKKHYCVMPMALWFKFPHFPREHEWGFITKIMNDLLISCQTFFQIFFSKMKKIKVSNYPFS